MKILEFYGSSDDIFIAGNDEFYTRKALINSDSEGRLFVVAEYLSNGCWSMGIAPYDEDEAMPTWKISYIQSKRGYSTVLRIEVPGDAEVIEHA